MTNYYAYCLGCEYKDNGTCKGIGDYKICSRHTIYRMLFGKTKNK